MVAITLVPAPAEELRTPVVPRNMNYVLLERILKWVQNQLALRIFIWIADMYKAEIEGEAG